MDGKSSPPPPLGKPAKVFDCPSCGGSVSIRALGQTVSVACRSCGSVIDATNENYQVISTASKNLKVEPLIPIGQRGKLHGVLWEVIGFMQRCDGTRTYTWSEYLLYNPGRGFRWLTEFDGHWNYVAVTKEKPKVDDSWSSRTFAHYMGKDYYLFHKGTAKVIYVMGEFYWKVSVGEKVSVEDYVAPPEILSCEKSKDEVTWAVGQYLPSDEVKAAFQLTKVALPFPRGVAPNQPSTLSSLAPSVGKYWALFLQLIVAIQFMGMVRAKNERVYQGNFVYRADDTEKVKVSPLFELGHGVTNVSFELSSPVSNNWLEVGVDLINDQTGTSYDFEQGVEYYFGRDSDGAWSEGSQTSRRILSSIPPGMYHFVVSPYGAVSNQASSKTSQSPPANDVGTQTGTPEIKKEFWPNGQLKQEEPFINGLRDGLANYYHDNGKPYGSIPWKNGQKHGRFKLFRADGTPDQELSYINGQLHGTSYWYNPDGSIRQTAYYQLGQISSSPPLTELPYTMVVRRDVVTWSNFLWALALVSFFPALVWWRSRSFELSRWSTSDFSPYWSHQEED